MEFTNHIRIIIKKNPYLNFFFYYSELSTRRMNKLHIFDETKYIADREFFSMVRNYRSIIIKDEIGELISNKLLNPFLYY
jgi:hypothetical protein